MAIPELGLYNIACLTRYIYCRPATLCTGLNKDIYHLIFFTNTPTTLKNLRIRQLPIQFYKNEPLDTYPGLQGKISLEAIGNSNDERNCQTTRKAKYIILYKIVNITYNSKLDSRYIKWRRDLQAQNLGLEHMKYRIREYIGSKNWRAISLRIIY